MEEWKYIEKLNNELEVSNTGKIRNSKSKKELKLYLDKQENELCVCYNKYHYVVKSEAEKEYFGEFAPQRNLFEKYGI